MKILSEYFDYDLLEKLIYKLFIQNIWTFEYL